MIIQTGSVIISAII